jgi:hypothetical protein
VYLAGRVCADVRLQKAAALAAEQGMGGCGAASALTAAFRRSLATSLPKSRLKQRSPLCLDDLGFSTDRTNSSSLAAPGGLRPLGYPRREVEGAHDAGGGREGGWYPVSEGVLCIPLPRPAAPHAGRSATVLAGLKA